MQQGPEALGASGNNSIVGEAQRVARASKIRGGDGGAADAKGKGPTFVFAERPSSHADLGDAASLALCRGVGRCW